MEKSDGKVAPGHLAPESHVNSNPSSQSESANCAFCGVEVDGPPASVPRRFGEAFCGEAHAEAFAAEVRAARVGAAANVAEGSTGPDHAGGEGAGPEAGRWSLKRIAKLAVCCGVPLLAVAFLAGGGGALLGAGAVVVPYLALLACPLGMFFMMRAMQGHAKNNDEREHSTRPEDSRKH